MPGTQFSLFFLRFPLMSDVHVTYHCVLICFLTFAVNSLCYNQLLEFLKGNEWRVRRKESSVREFSCRTGEQHVKIRTGTKTLQEFL